MILAPLALLGTPQSTFHDAPKIDDIFMPMSQDKWYTIFELIIAIELHKLFVEFWSKAFKIGSHFWALKSTAVW